jgi:hypothetical protein
VVFRNNIKGTGQGIAAIDYRHGAFHDLNAIDIIQGELPKVNPVSHPASHRYAIDQYFYVLARQAPDSDEITQYTCWAELKTRLSPEQISQIIGRLQLKLPVIDDIDLVYRLVCALRPELTGYHYLLDL